MLVATEIHKAHGDLQVLRGVDVSLAAGEVVSIVGPSGAGKTTLLNVLSTLDRPDSGSVVVDGIEVAGLRDKALARFRNCLLYTSPSPRDQRGSRMPSSA